MSREPRLEAHSTTHSGCVRTANEDSLASLERERVWVVADGMGGHANGQHASRTVAATIESARIPEELAGACDAVSAAIAAANAQLFAEANESGERMGSTVVSLIVRGQQFAVLWTGDSRAYLKRGGTLRQLTRDHTQVQQLLDRGLIDAAEAENHPLGHILVRAVGVQPEVAVDTVIDTTEIGDVFVLCSDGLHGVLSDVEISEILEDPGREAAEKLIETCLERGAPDNVTVTIVRVCEATMLMFAANQDAM